MIVVSDTSPIVNLAAVDQLNLLQRLYGRVVIPAYVYREIVITGKGQAGAKQVEECAWIETRQVANESLVDSLQLELDRGEAEAIALALELKADMILIDERRGRQAASRLNLHFIGLLGILVEAKKKGLVTDVQTILDDLIKKAGFWIDRSLYEHVLSAAGE